MRRPAPRPLRLRQTLVLILVIMVSYLLLYHMLVDLMSKPDIQEQAGVEPPRIIDI